MCQRAERYTQRVWIPFSHRSRNGQPTKRPHKDPPRKKFITKRKVTRNNLVHTHTHVDDDGDVCVFISFSTLRRLSAWRIFLRFCMIRYFDASSSSWVCFVLESSSSQLSLIEWEINAENFFFALVVAAAVVWFNTIYRRWPHIIIGSTPKHAYCYPMRACACVFVVSVVVSFRCVGQM